MARRWWRIFEKIVSAERLPIIILGFLGGLVTLVVSEVVRHVFIPERHLVAVSNMNVDWTIYRQADASIKWTFVLQPEQMFVFSRGPLLGCFLHIEARADEKAILKGFDFRHYDGVKFFIKASVEGLSVSEFNVFVGEEYVQYIAERTHPIRISTRWSEISISFDEFQLAPWVDRRGRRLPMDLVTEGTDALQNVTALGLDIKTRRGRVEGTIWVDYIRLIKGNSERVLVDANGIQGSFQESSFVWITGAAQY